MIKDRHCFILMGHVPKMLGPAPLNQYSRGGDILILVANMGQVTKTQDTTFPIMQPNLAANKQPGIERVILTELLKVTTQDTTFNM